jgi:hypothetical protein
MSHRLIVSFANDCLSDDSKHDGTLLGCSQFNFKNKIIDYTKDLQRETPNQMLVQDVFNEISLAIIL